MNKSKTTKITYSPEKSQPSGKDTRPRFHFFASSVCTWRSSENMEQLITDMKREEYSFNLFYVPLDEKAPYKISMYSPQVEGAVYLGFFAAAQRTSE